MEIKYCKINPTGNITLIVETPVLRESQAAVAAYLMSLDRDAEQVGFIESPENHDCALRLQMMGGEFCGNASISAAALYFSKSVPSPADKSTVNIEVSGAENPLAVSVEFIGGNTFCGSVSMPLPEAVYDCELCYNDKSCTLPLVRMPGICHAIVKDSSALNFAENAISEWCRQLDAEALGLMFYDVAEGLLKPLVFVESTGSTVWESSCASGSCAVSAYESLRSGMSGTLSLRQPGGTLRVKSSCEGGKLQDITLTGNADIIGYCSAVIDT